MVVEALLEACRRRQRDLEQQVFSTPPATFDQFQKLLGRWVELNETAAWLNEELKRLDEDES